MEHFVDSMQEVLNSTDCGWLDRPAGEVRIVRDRFNDVTVWVHWFGD